MQLFDFLVLTPEKTLYEGKVVSAIFPGEDGFFEILANHAPFIAMIKAGDIHLVDRNKKKQVLNVTSGYFEFYQNKGILIISVP